LTPVDVQTVVVETVDVQTVDVPRVDVLVQRVDVELDVELNIYFK